MSLLQDVLFGTWTPPEVFTTRSHRVMSYVSGEPRTPKAPVHSRTKILAALDRFKWMTNKEISEKCGVKVETVGTMTKRMADAKRIERKHKKDPSDPISYPIYRLK